jgi:hypothetical protein
MPISSQRHHLNTMGSQVTNQSRSEDIIFRDQPFTGFPVLWFEMYVRLLQHLIVPTNLLKRSPREIKLFMFCNVVSYISAHVQHHLPKQLLLALIPIFINFVRFFVAVLPFSYAQSNKKNAKTRAMSSITGTSCGSRESCPRRSRVQRFHNAVPRLSISSAFDVANAPSLLGKSAICLSTSCRSVTAVLEDDAVGSCASNSAAKAAKTISKQTTSFHCWRTCILLL